MPKRSMDAPNSMACEKYDGIFFFAWVIPAIGALILLGIFFLRFLLNLPAVTRWRFLIAGGLYIGGAVGIEMLSARHSEIMGGNNITYNLITTLEESLEMIGISTFIWALLKYYEERYGTLSLRFG